MKLQLTGKLHSIARDFLTNKIIISLLVNESDFSTDQIQDNLDISISKHRKKRSLDANAYAWVLMSKLAALNKTSKEEVYELMLRRYGFPYEDDDGYIVVTVKKSVDMGKIDGHWLRYKGNESFTSYLMLKGSSEYDTAEMSHFIDGIISECKESGIETLTPTELERMKAAWHLNIQ